MEEPDLRSLKGSKMMTNETALKLIEALNRHSAALEKLTGLNSLAGGINVYHHGQSQFQRPELGPGSFRKGP